MLNYDRIPEHCRESLRAYIEHGRPVGDFLRCLLSNDLVGAFRHADDENREHMEDYVRWLWNETPGDAWGSGEAYSEWVERGGLGHAEEAKP